MSRFNQKRHHSFDFGQVQSHYGNYETSILKLLVLKDGLDMYD